MKQTLWAGYLCWFPHNFHFPQKDRIITKVVLWGQWLFLLGGTENFQMSKLDLEKAEEPEIKLPTSVGSLKKQENSRKTSTSALLNMLKPLTVWITINCGKLLEMGIPDHRTCLLRNLYAGQEATAGTGHGTTDWFKLGKEYVKPVYCHQLI